MNEYYYIIDNKQLGPVSITELINKGLLVETLVWTAGMEEWEMIKNIPELMKEVKPKIGPPPIPTGLVDTNTFKNPDHINVILKKEEKQSFQIFGGDQKKLNWFIGWCILHSFAMLMSYSQIAIFNSGKSSTSRFWPFVEYHEAPYQTLRFIKDPRFLGIFKDYDFTEFIFYVSAAFIILQIISSKKKEAAN